VDPAPEVIPPGPPHDYLSTSCWHGHHALCRRLCKYCPALCRCECHGLEPDIHVGGAVLVNSRPPSPEELGEPL
jgi:hypothetical protein